MQQSHIDQFSHQQIEPQKLFINGAWHEARGEPLPVISPIDGKIISHIGNALREDVDDAVHSARCAFESGVWSRASPSYRKKILFKIADLIEAHSLELAVLGVRDNGTEITMAHKAEPLSAAATFRYYAEAIDKIYGEVAPTDLSILSMIVRDPLGVVGAIIPWNFPLMISAWKIAAALAVGNSVILKPSEIASLSTLKLAKIALDVGLPEGVLNIITGEGQITGAAMALHNDIDAIGFTGSGRTGRLLMEASAHSNMKRLSLELGGKSPNIIFADCDNLEEAAKISAAGIFRNSGEVCIAGSRLLIERPLLKEFTALMIAEARSLHIGNPLSLNTQIGAITHEAQLHSDLNFVKTAVAEGATLLTGGMRLLEDTGGFYMSPTILGDVTPNMAIFQKEVFGPLLTITAFDSEEEAIALANNSPLGLASGLWTNNLSRAHRMIRSLKAGVVHVNCYGGADATVPLCAVKQSGNGADKSLHALEKYTYLKTAWIKL